MTENAAREVHCDTHGASPYALICVHLRQASGLEYFAVPRCEHGPAQAWCCVCDGVVQTERGWTDASEEHAQFNLFCAECYRTTLRGHRFVAYSKGPDETCDWAGLDPPDA